MSKKPIYLYLDQHGNRFYARTVKELREQIPGKSTPMYADQLDGDSYRTGQVIGQHWLTKYAPVRELISRSN
jgi:hypothetical protein